MAQMSVEQFASELGLLPAVLLEQLQAAGVSKQLAKDSLTEQDKTQLLDYLRKVHGAKEDKGKITFTRRQTSEIKKSDSTGKARTIQVEVRKKRVFVKRDLAEETTGKEEAVESAVPTPPPALAPAPASVVDAASVADIDSAEPIDGSTTCGALSMSATSVKGAKSSPSVKAR